MQEVMHLIEQVAPSSASVLITGETGSGKEILARTIHRLSPRTDRPFIAINCSAIPESLMESEIFGHERGAFTGAAERRLGCFELADGGTLLLDEIGEMPAPTQAKLLRVLEDHKVRRLGNKVETPVDVRVLAATNKEPEQAVSKGELRQDLYFRLNVFHVHLPALRDHKEDIPLLVEHILRDINTKHGRHVRGVNPEVLDLFAGYSWPGNVRELRNVLERAVILARGGSLEFDLPIAKQPSPLPRPAARPSNEADGAQPILTEAELERQERDNVVAALERTNWKIKGSDGACELLGVKPSTLITRMKKWGLERPASV